MPRSKPAREAYMQGKADAERGKPQRSIGTLAAMFGMDDFDNMTYWYLRGYEE